MKYMFRCRNCAEVHEVELGMHAERPRLCRCGGDYERIFTAPFVHYRGSGFYSTDKLYTKVHPLDYNSDEDRPDEVMK